MDDELFFLSKRKIEKSVNFDFIFLKIVLILVFTLFLTFFFFFYLQIYFKKEALSIEKNIKYLTFFYFPPRGNIYDRNGKLLATSEKVYDLYLNMNLASEEEKRIAQKIIKETNPLVFYWGDELIIRFLELKDINQILVFKEKYPHIFVIPSYRRVYLGGEELGNLLGYVGLSSDSEIKGEFRGLAGLELTYDKYLRGKVGKVVYQKTKNGLKKIYEEEPIKGNDLYLTIDYDYQKGAYEKIKEYFQNNGYEKGPFIALNPNNGEILAFISYPSFDPNIFIKQRDKIKEILNNKNQPLFNRIVGGLYAPGSTIKLIVAAGALEEKIVTPETKIYSAGEIKIPNPYFPGTYSVFRDNKVHGWTDIYKAISDSVNIYFYAVGGGYPYDSQEIPIREGLGIYRLLKYWKLYNLGEKSGIDFIGEKEGFLPSPETKAKNVFDKIWRLGDTYNVSIGQGDLLVTPLQIALWTSAMATNKIYQPFLVKKIVDEKGKIIFERKPTLLRENLIKEENLKIIQEGMRRTVTQGTAKNYLKDLPLAGKSGTPQVFGKNKLNAIFTGYLFYNKPEVVMTVLIEEVPIGSVATLPLYRELVKMYLDKYHGGNSF